MAHSNATTNRLSKEKSPYLLQHQFNPVDWYAWNEEAFTKAREENKPIFLSIGYSTCHWCHVMERESFENVELARVLNQHFVSIKVDREERPDVDKIYMTFVQAMTGQGGWPLNVFLTPDLKPFYGGTYWPPETKYGRPSFLQVLQQIAQVWQTRRGDVTLSAEDFHQKLGNMVCQKRDEQYPLTPSILRTAHSQFKSEYDSHHGGFGGAPKFPRPSQPLFMLRQAVRNAGSDGVEMVLHTCEKMAAGGIYDQLGGGFARYSVDAKWLVPHFEKMLYDNAQLLQLYLDAYLVSREDKFAAVARDIIRYIQSDMTHPEGGFYSAEDADSEGKEGKFYSWTRKELSTLLTNEEFNVVSKHFGITEAGNFIDHSDPNPLLGLNILSVVDPAFREEDKPLLEAAKRKMSETRAQRVRPHLDDKILASWNGMMLGAIARTSAVLREPLYRELAEKNLRFLQSQLWDSKTKTLYHRWRDGERDNVQLLDAYANLLGGVIELYEATLNPAHLEFAVALAESMMQRFFDPDLGGFWQSAAASKDLILRIKDDYDGAEPSGNSVACLALLRLSAICDRKDFREAVEKTLHLFAERLHKLPQAVPHLLLAMDFWADEPRRVVIAGDVDSRETQELLAAAHSVYQPNKVILGVAGPVEEFARTLPADGRSKAYLCTGTACQAPTSDAATLIKGLSVR